MTGIETDLRRDFDSLQGRLQEMTEAKEASDQKVKELTEIETDLRGDID